MIKNFMSVFFLFFPFTALADKQPLIETFVLCNPNFFSTIYNNKDELQQFTNIQTVDENLAYIQVTNRVDASKNFLYFSTPFKYKDLTIKGYYDSAMDLGRIGKYYFWGFIIDNDIKQIKNTLNFLKWKNMEDNQLYIANPKIRNINEDVQVWHDNNGTVIGVKTVPAPNTTEKLLLLEKGANMTLLICSIQGVVSSELLKRERPDIQ